MLSMWSCTTSSSRSSLSSRLTTPFVSSSSPAPAERSRPARAGSRRSTPAVNDIDRRARAHLGGRTCELIDRLPQVVIGAANGLAVGGGVVLLSCCDLRVAAESAWFSIPEVELDLPLTWQALPRLMREVGPARTKELVMVCERFTSAQALQWGFLNNVVPDDQVIVEARPRG